MIINKKTVYRAPAVRVAGVATEPLMLVKSKDRVDSQGPEDLDPIDDFEW